MKKSPGLGNSGPVEGTDPEVNREEVALKAFFKEGKLAWPMGKVKENGVGGMATTNLLYVLPMPHGAANMRVHQSLCRDLFSSG